MTIQTSRRPSCPRLIRSGLLLLVILGIPSVEGEAQDAARTLASTPTPRLEVTPARQVLCAGDTATFQAVRGSTAVEADWSIDPILRGIPVTSASGAKQFDFTAPKPLGTTAVIGLVRVIAEAPRPRADTRNPAEDATPRNDEGQEALETAAAVVELAGACSGPFGGELARFTIGYEQIGAAGIESTQRYSFDAHMSRPLPLDVTPLRSDFYLGPPVRWWGKVRVGSYPQQVSAEVQKFASAFASNAGALKVNELVRSAEFQTGLEVRILGSHVPLQAITEETRQRFAFMLFAGWGGIGPLPPVTEAAVFAVPADDGSPQSQAFKRAHPDVASSYVAFLPPSASRFLGQWSVGARLYTFAVAGRGREPQTSAPAVVDIAFGRNKLVSDSRHVLFASAFYPFAFGDRTQPDTIVVYFFGDAIMARERGEPELPLFLRPALDDDQQPIPLTHPQVSVVRARDTNRDTYRVGVAIDLLRLWNRLKAPAAGK